MSRHIKLLCFGVVLLACANERQPVIAGLLEYGDEDVLGTGIYPGDPKAGATLEGLAPDVVTFGAAPVGHFFGFFPAIGELPGTDQIFIGSVQTASHNGYSVSSPTQGPQVITLDYSSLVPLGQSIATLTLGVAADDFQFPGFGQPYNALVNGSAAPVLTNVLNSVSQGGPVVQFFTIGVSPASLTLTHVLTLSIDNGGDGGDGWAVDFLTIGVTTTPEPSATLIAAIGMVGLLPTRRPKRG